MAATQPVRPMPAELKEGLTIKFGLVSMRVANWIDIYGENIIR